MNDRAELNTVSRRRVMKRVGVLGLGAALLPTTSAAAALNQASTRDLDAVEFTERSRIESLLAHDAEAVGAVTAADFEFITPLGTVQTRDMFVEGIASGVIDNHVLEPTEAMRIRAFADTAAVRYQARSELAVGGVEYALDLWFTAHYEIRNGDWQIVWLQATELPADQ